MQQNKIDSLKKQLWNAADYQGIYAIVKQFPASQKLLRHLAKEYHVYYNPNNQRFETDTSDASHYLDANYTDVKECLSTIIDEDY